MIVIGTQIFRGTACASCRKNSASSSPWRRSSSTTMGCVRCPPASATFRPSPTSTSGISSLHGLLVAYETTNIKTCHLFSFLPFILSGSISALGILTAVRKLCGIYISSKSNEIKPTSPNVLLACGLQSSNPLWWKYYCPSRKNPENATFSFGIFAAKNPRNVACKEECHEICGIFMHFKQKDCGNLQKLGIFEKNCSLKKVSPTGLNTEGVPALQHDRLRSNTQFHSVQSSRNHVSLAYFVHFSAKSAMYAMRHKRVIFWNKSSHHTHDSANNQVFIGGTWKKEQ